MTSLPLPLGASAAGIVNASRAPSTRRLTEALSCRAPLPLLPGRLSCVWHTTASCPALL